MRVDPIALHWRGIAQQLGGPSANLCARLGLGRGRGICSSYRAGRADVNRAVVSFGVVHSLVAIIGRALIGLVSHIIHLPDRARASKRDEFTHTHRLNCVEFGFAAIALAVTCRLFVFATRERAEQVARRATRRGCGAQAPC